jgi:pyruvate,water dikinase
MQEFIIPFDQLGIGDVGKVGGKNASLGEMVVQLSSMGIRIPDGFATTAAAFRIFLRENGLEEVIQTELAKLDRQYFTNLQSVSTQIKTRIFGASLPKELADQVIAAYRELAKGSVKELGLAVRSSATAEDLPGASFAGQHDSFLNVKGEKGLLKKVLACFASLYNARAIKYRYDKGFSDSSIALSVGVQRMVRADLGSSGVLFTLDPESGFDQVVVLTGCWGLGENIVQGTVIPDEFVVFKPTLLQGKRAILSKKMGSKSKTLVYAEDGGVVNRDTSVKKQEQWVLQEVEVEQLARWALLIEKHYQMPMDIEWAKDGITGNLYIVQARPETIHAGKDSLIQTEYTLLEQGKVLVTGVAIGSGISSGKIRILHSPEEGHLLEEGEILLTEITNPDWDPVLKRAAAIITTKGGRTSHAAIVARELGTLALVGAEGAFKALQTGDLVTLSNASGKLGIIYEGSLKWKETLHDFRGLQLPHTQAQLILADPEKAFSTALFPNQGVGLMRMEFVIANSIRIHPIALVHWEELKNKKEKGEIAKICRGYADKKEYFVDTLAQAVGTIAAAFYPKEVLLRMSDFKSNEYAHLLGGSQFEVDEENPMLGFRGAFRYTHERYKAAFLLECEAVKRVREDMGLTNLNVMIPFCRSPEEGKKVRDLMGSVGLKQKKNGLKLYVMAEIPANVIQAAEFAEIFDGFSIGSNDLTQLTLGVDRDSEIMGDIFDETNPSVLWMIAELIRVAKPKGKKVGLCGQAPSDLPEFTQYLIAQGIDSISFQVDALLSGIQTMLAAEKKLNKTQSKS